MQQDKRYSVWIGWDSREAAAFAVAKHSAKRRMSLRCIPVRGVVLDQLVGSGLYRREMQERQGPAGNKILWDAISDAPCSTSFAISRFFVPLLAEQGWALFTDCDVLFRFSLTRIFDELDDRYAVYCVKHPEMPDASGIKMVSQIQTAYKRKNWSSVMLFNCDHPANKALTLDLLNKAPGRDLHRFCWLDDDAIGELGPEFNYLVGVSKAPSVPPKIVHFTRGTPDMPGFEDCEFAEEWRSELADWAAGH